MNNKAVFFDADGTICDIKKGTPDSAVESIKKTGGKWSSGMALYRTEQGICTLVSGTDSIYRNDQCMWSYHRKRRQTVV